MRILIVDDDAVFREEFSMFLSDEGHEVATAASAARAVEALEQGEFEAVFTDLKMPRESGIDLLKTVRDRWPRQLVVMVTGYATVATAVEAMKLGAFDYIGKPFRTDQVRKVLDLVADEVRYAGPRLAKGEPVDLATEIATREGIPVLLAGPPPAPKALPAGVTFFEFDGSEPSRLRDAIDASLRASPKVGVVLAHAEQTLDGHRTEDIVAWLVSMRELLEGRGVLAIGLDARGATQAQVHAITSALAGPAVHGTLEALANPIRRRIVSRLAEGPTSFSTLMHAAELDDSPKMSFHMHRLLEEGLVAHSADEYRLTPKGEGASTVLRDMETTVGNRSGGTVLFRPTKPPSHR